MNNLKITLFLALLLILFSGASVAFSNDFSKDIQDIINNSSEMLKQASLDEKKRNIITKLAIKAGFSEVDKIEMVISGPGKMNIVYRVFENDIYKGSKEIIQRDMLIASKNLTFSTLDSDDSNLFELDGFYTNGKTRTINKCAVSRKEFSSVIINSSGISCEIINEIFFVLKNNRSLIPVQLKAEYHELDFGKALSLRLQKDGTYDLNFKIAPERMKVLNFSKDKNGIKVNSIRLMLF